MIGDDEEAQQIHNTSNIIAVNATTHTKITGYYNTTTFRFTNGLSVRDWLAGQSYEYQYEFGLDILRQFRWLNEKIGRSIKGYTWHHTEILGKMQLVPTGIHNITTHNGGRTAGMWAGAPR